MEFTEALFIFIGGAMSHAVLSRALGIYSKVKIARIALINCFAIISFSGRHAQSFLQQTCEDEATKPYIAGAVRYWQNLSFLTLKNTVPLNIWQSLGVKDWNDVEALIKKLEQVGEKNEQE